MSDRFDLVLFDIGGVLGVLDPPAIAAAAAERGVDGWPTFRYFRSAYEPDAPGDHPWCRAERGEIGFDELVALAGDDAPGIDVMLDPGLGLMLAGMTPSPEWRALAAEVKASGVRVAALTNTLFGLNVAATMRHKPVEWSFMADVFGDDVIESHVVGTRKPEAAIFDEALTRFGADPARTLFVDDEPVNCDGARRAGITAIHHDDGDRARAEFRSLLGLDGVLN